MDIWQICGLMINQLKTRLNDKQINLVVELSVQAFLTDEGYDPIYGARPLRRAITKYLEDTLAENCLANPLYARTKLIVRRKKVEGTLMTYTNDIEVEIDYADVDPELLKSSESDVNESSESDSFTSDIKDKEKPKRTLAGRASRLFRKSDRKTNETKKN